MGYNHDLIPLDDLEYAAHCFKCWQFAKIFSDYEPVIK